MTKHIVLVLLLGTLAVATACGSSSDASPRAVCEKMLALEGKGTADLDDCAGDLARLKEGNGKLYSCLSKCAMAASSKDAADQCAASCDGDDGESRDDTEVAVVEPTEALEPLTLDECAAIVKTMAGMDGIEEFWPSYSIEKDILKELEDCAEGRNDPYRIKGYRCTVEKAEQHLSYGLALDRCW